MGLILDTSVLISAKRAKLDLVRLLKSEAPDEPVALTSIIASELLHGCERAPAGKIRESRKEFVENLLRSLPCLPFGLEEAREHAGIWAELAGKGELIGAHDLMIAATCRTYNYRLATTNLGEFGRIPQLRLVDSSPYLT